MIIMKKASSTKLAAKLRHLTSYSTVRENATRWSHTFQMVLRFLKLQPELSCIVELLSLFPTHVELETLTRAHASLKKFKDVKVMLVAEGRELFDVFLQDFSDFSHHIWLMTQPSSTTQYPRRLFLLSVSGCL